eukprot:Selendium_serpulae@DN5372_c0_g1_i1.p1
MLRVVIFLLTLHAAFALGFGGKRRKGGLFGLRDDDDDVEVIRMGGQPPPITGFGVPPFMIPGAGGFNLGGFGGQGGFNLPPPIIQTINPQPQSITGSGPQTQAEEEALLDLSVAPPPPPASSPQSVPSPSSAQNASPGKKRRVMITDDPVLVCPPGFTLKTDYCLQEDIQYSARTCPPDWHFDQDTAECSKMTVVSPQFVCDEGFTPKASKCFKVHTAPQQLTCDSGFDIEDTHCVRYVQTTPDLSCQAGFELDEMHPEFCIMVVTAKPEMFCKHGYEPSGGMCIKNVTRPKNKRGKCDLPYMPSSDGHCLKVEVFQAKLKCPRGTDLVPPMDPLEPHEMCEGFMKEPAQLHCHPDYEEIFIDDELMCKGRVTASAKIVCPEGFEYIEHQCMKQTQINKRAVCPQGFAYENGQCLQPQYLQSRMGCPVGYKILPTDVTYCVKELRTAPQYGCEENDMEYDPIVKVCHKEDFITEGSKSTESTRNTVDLSLIVDSPFR